MSHLVLLSSPPVRLRVATGRNPGSPPPAADVIIVGAAPRSKERMRCHTDHDHRLSPRGPGGPVGGRSRGWAVSRAGGPAGRGFYWLATSG